MPGRAAYVGSYSSSPVGEAGDGGYQQLVLAPAAAPVRSRSGAAMSGIRGRAATPPPPLGPTSRSSRRASRSSQGRLSDEKVGRGGRSITMAGPGSSQALARPRVVAARSTTSAVAPVSRPVGRTPSHPSFRERESVAPALRSSSARTVAMPPPTSTSLPRTSAAPPRRPSNVVVAPQPRSRMRTCVAVSTTLTVMLLGCCLIGVVTAVLIILFT
jgi:hypothetical protein